MTVKIDKTGWLQLFTQRRRPLGFLTRFFTIKPGGIFAGTKIAIDVERYGEDVAIVIRRCTGPNLNDFDIFTTKEFEPPSYGESFPLDVCELLSRMAGVDPFTAAYLGDAAQVQDKMLRGFGLISDKIMRAVELQASQILQTGQLTLVNAAGETVYDLDFKPKATHFPTVGVSWSVTATADPLSDLESLATVIRADGQVEPNILIMGATALRFFVRNTEVKEQLDNRHFEVGEIAPQFTNSGATLYGHVWVGTYRFAIWAYPETFKDPQTGNVTKYINDDKVVMISDSTRMDMVSAKVPLPLGPDPRVANLLPGRISSRADSMDVTPNVYPTPNGKQIMGELESRTLLIPVQIDGFGCLDTEI